MDDTYNIYAAMQDCPYHKPDGIQDAYESPDPIRSYKGTLKLKKPCDTTLAEDIPHFCGRVVLNEEEYEGMPCRFCKSSTTWINVCDNVHCNV